MKQHRLKIWPKFFAEVKSGRKTFEVRRDDRGFQEGDTVVLAEWEPDLLSFTGNERTFTIGFMLRGPEWGLPEGLAVFSLVK